VILRDQVESTPVPGTPGSAVRRSAPRAAKAGVSAGRFARGPHIDPREIFSRVPPAAEGAAHRRSRSHGRRGALVRLTTNLTQGHSGEQS